MDAVLELSITLTSSGIFQAPTQECGNLLQLLIHTWQYSQTSGMNTQIMDIDLVADNNILITSNCLYFRLGNTKPTLGPSSRSQRWIVPYFLLGIYIIQILSVCVSVKYRRPNCWTDHDQIWHAYADRPGTGSYQKLAP